MNKIIHKVYINFPIKMVFSSLIDSNVWNSWFTTKCYIGKAIGERIDFFWENYGVDQLNISDGGEIIQWKEPSLFGFTWKPGESVTSVRFALSVRGRGTVVTLEESGYSDSQEDYEAFKSCSVGWGEALTLFKFYLEHGITYGSIPDSQNLEQI
jgi:uncharacterized protein YndB with AHSA1/START domain